MAYVESQPLFARSELVRWSTAAIVVLALHVLAAVVLSMHSDASDDEAGAPVVMIELAPMAVAPQAPPSDYAPGPQQPQAQTQERPREEAKPEQKEPDPVPIPDTMPAPNPTIALPLPVPDPPKEPVEEKVQVQPQEQAPVPTAPPAAVAQAARPASPALGRVAQPTSAAVAGWQRSLMAHLERHKRYPPEANGEQGIVKLAFSIDRSGHVLSSRIIRSSGSAVLDRETLAMVRRVQPLPRPPADLSDVLLTVIVELGYER
jgi:periplasmic protein TonB